MSRPMTVGDLRRALVDLPDDVVIWVEGCKAGDCRSTIRSLQIESGMVGRTHTPTRVEVSRHLENPVPLPPRRRRPRLPS